MSRSRRLVVGVDGSEGSRHALAWAVGLLGDTGGNDSSGEIIAVHALGLLAHLSGMVEPSIGHRNDVARLLDDEWCRPLAHARIAHRSLLVEGQPVLALITAAREEGADLIVVGRRGAGGSPGLMIGSASQQLVRHADCPVVVVPPPLPEVPGIVG